MEGSLSSLLRERVLLDHSYDSELRIGRSAGNGRRFFEFESRPLPFLSVVRRQNEKVGVSLFGMWADRDGPKSATCGAYPGVEIKIIAQHESAPLSAEAWGSRMFPDCSFDFVKVLRKSGFDLLILPQVFDDLQNRLDSGHFGFGFPLGGIR